MTKMLCVGLLAASFAFARACAAEDLQVGTSDLSSSQKAVSPAPPYRAPIFDIAGPQEGRLLEGTRVPERTKSGGLGCRLRRQSWIALRDRR